MASSAEYSRLLYSLKGRLALVTGASSGIGLATAHRLAEAGCDLVLVARRAERLEALREQLAAQYQVRALALPTDLADPAAVDRLPGRLPADFTSVDLLVNNAGLALGRHAVQDNPVDDTNAMLATNCTSVVSLTRYFSRGMLERNRGHIINISSTAAQEHYAGGSVYCGTKAFLAAFTNSIRHDVVGSRVRVTSISPGAVNTEFSTVRFKGDKEKADAVYKGLEPLTAADIADHVLYAATRPEHVQIGDITVYATFQSSATTLARPLAQ